MEGITTPRSLNSYLVSLIQNKSLSYVVYVCCLHVKYCDRGKKCGRYTEDFFRNDLIARRVSRTVLTQREFNVDNKGTIEVKKASMLSHEDTSSSSDRNSPNVIFIAHHGYACFANFDTTVVIYKH